MTAKTDGKLCFSWIPARYVFIFLTSFGVFLVYAYKGFLSVAIVAMATQDVTDESTGHECINTNDLHPNNTETTGEFSWSDQQQALILGSFFYGYIVLQVPAGILADTVGSKWIFGGSLFITAILSLLGPVAARAGFVPFLITRILQGLAEGVTLPCMSAMVSRWMPKMERSRGISIIFAGGAIGSVVVLPLTGYLCNNRFLGGWPAIFYVLGIIGCVWFVFWAIFVFDSPDVHPFISSAEFNYIREGQGDERATHLVIQYNFY